MSYPSQNGAPGTGPYNNDNARPTSSASGFTPFRPRSVGAGQQDYGNGSPSISAGPQPPARYPTPSTGYGQMSYPQQSYSYQPQPQYYQQPEPYAQPNTPFQISNPFPLPGQGGGGRYDNSTYDPEMEAQLAQWQSTYAAKDEPGYKASVSGTGTGPASAGGANAVALGSRPTPLSNQELASAVKGDSGVASIVNGADGKQKTVVRSGGGETWQDSSLLEWDPAHFRIFVGNLAGEVTDDSLAKAFGKYDSVQKARVIRDKRTTKSKGFGFVSFSDGDQYFQAVKDMQGKYIGSHPVLLKRSTTEIKPTTPFNKNKKYQKGGKNNGKSGGGNARAEAGGHAETGAGVKKQPKTKGGLKILG